MNPLEHAVDIELDFICDTCGRPIEDGEGALYVRHADIVRARTDHAEWEKKHASGSIDIVSLLTLGAPAPWRIQHDACGAAEEDGYDVSVERVRTWRALLGWTAHLMEKTWLPVTNWASVIGDAAEGRSARIAAHARDDAA
jgi:hypothetical protein